MRKAIQLVLCLFAVAALVVTGVAFYQIVLASTIHGAPVRFIGATAGSYPLKLALYNDPINAGDAIPFAIAVAPGTRGAAHLPGDGQPRSRCPRRAFTGRCQRSAKHALWRARQHYAGDAWAVDAQYRHHRACRARRSRDPLDRSRAPGDASVAGLEHRPAAPLRLAALLGGANPAHSKEAVRGWAF